MSVIDFYKSIKTGKILDKPVLILRHDVDHHLKTAEKMFNFHVNNSITSTFYFRLSTFRKNLIERMVLFGTEASYHNEELSDHIKMTGRLMNQIDYNTFNAIQNDFISKVRSLREKFDIPIKSVAAHGDFINRKLGLVNNLIINDFVKTKLQIDVEAYEPVLMNSVDIYVSDSVYPNEFNIDFPIDDLITQRKNIMLLIHPNNWEINLVEQIKVNTIRIIEGIMIFLRLPNKNITITSLKRLRKKNGFNR